MNEIRVRSWHELNEQLFAESWRPALGRYRSSFAFRGMEEAGDDLTTSLIRLGGDFAKQERHLIRNFRKYASRDAVPGDLTWNWLALAQHHGLPTRLLDWTFSPYVALHFATANIDLFGLDGVIWCVDYVKTHALLPEPLRKVLAEEQADVFTAEMLHRAAQSIGELDRMAGGGEFALFLDPPSLDERIINQFALLSMMSSPQARLDDWLGQRPQLHRRIIIPAELKWEVRDKLDQANITERVLFPGLDGLGRWLRRYYSPRHTHTIEDPLEQASVREDQRNQ